MAVTEILQSPLIPGVLPQEINVLPVGQDIIFVVANDDAVYNQTKVKFTAEVHISGDPYLPPYGGPPNTSTTDALIGTFKTTPNNAGVGIFNFRNIIENYVKADNQGFVLSEFKGTQTGFSTTGIIPPIQLIDKFSMNRNSFRYLAIRFAVEYLGGDSSLPSTAVGTPSGITVVSSLYGVFNGYVKHSDTNTTEVNSQNIAEFGLDIQKFRLFSIDQEFLTNAPTTQSALADDYGTMSYLLTNSPSANNVNKIRFTYYSSAGVQIGTEDMDRSALNGAYATYNAGTSAQILTFGVFPGNLQNWSTTFQGLLGTYGSGIYYTVQARGGFPSNCSKIYRINVKCPDPKNFESIRLCWLNQWGVWDYYTFTKKSIRTISNKPVLYQQSEGTWNARGYRTDSYKGGKKNFRVNTIEKIKINTDYENEDVNVMFEELTNSIEVYMLKGYSTDMTINTLDGAVTPVRVNSKSFVRKTVANDRLIQYTFEIEKTKTFRTQSV
tara:strand:+ start:669 stop:2153 length:1485 start_codon:yes stop_codon:yes gene_type:complete